MANSNIGLTLNDIVTPAVIVDKEKVVKNCHKITKLCQDLKINLRAHTKTHKTIEIVDLQTEGSRRSLVCSTLSECEFYEKNSCDDILFAFPLGIQHMKRVTKLVSRLNNFHVMITSEAMVDFLVATAPPKSKLWSVFLKIDCGYHRAGIWWENIEKVKKMITKLNGSTHTFFHGVYVHCGNSYYQPTANEVSETSDQNIERLLQLVNTLKSDGIACPTFGVGSTPSCSNPGKLMGKINEIHPGNYVFYDVQQSKLGSCKLEDIAICVATRIIGHYPHQNKMLVDCGFTALTKQGWGEMESSFAVVKDEPNLSLVSMTQEIGQIKAIEGVLDFEKYPVGTILFLLPWHSCATAAQHSSYLVLQSGVVVEEWKNVKGW